jgi:membrane associated rhomboid family serine protease
MATCYRHPNRETGVSCSNCGNPICPDCMTTTPVGMRCPDCAGQKTKVHTIGTVSGPPRATIALIVLNVLIFIGTRTLTPELNACGFTRVPDFALCGPYVDTGNEYWRLVTVGFLHGGTIHILFNMYVLWWLGNELEPSLGTPRFVALYAACLLGGSLGVLLLDPTRNTVGASGAVFGLFAAVFIFQRARGIDPMQSGIGPIILLNLAITFIVPNLSIGGHLGGLATGALTAFAMQEVSKRRRGNAAPIAVCVLIGAVAVAASLMVASGINEPIF